MREPYKSLATEIADTMVAAQDEVSCITRMSLLRALRVVMQKYEIELRAIPLDKADIDELPRLCPVCRKSLETVSSVYQFPDECGRYAQAHVECVVMPKKVP